MKTARLKSEQEERAGLKEEEEARLVEDARREAKENEHAQLKVEEGVRLALEARRKGGGGGFRARKRALLSN